MWAAVEAIIGGVDSNRSRLRTVHLDPGTLKELLHVEAEEALSEKTLKDMLRSLVADSDIYNQYALPFGLVSLRRAISDYYERFYGFKPDPETEITVTLGATEGVSSAIRSITAPGDGVLILQPFHEMYVNQARAFGCVCEFSTLKEDLSKETWELDFNDIERCLSMEHVKVFIINSPHNPTGKLFLRHELEKLCDLCLKYKVRIITDEIYEHMIYEPGPITSSGVPEVHHCLFKWKSIKENVICVNSLSKTGSATGWRVGWALAVSALTNRLRAVHDTIAMQAPTPLQVATEALLASDKIVHNEMRERYQANRDFLVQELRNLGFGVTQPQGSYYLFVRYNKLGPINTMTPHEAAEFLVKEARVAVVPGDAFYFTGCPEKNMYLRFAFCKSQHYLEEGIRRLSVSCFSRFL